MHLGLIGYGSIARALMKRLTAVDVDEVTVLVRPSRLAEAQNQSPEGLKVTFVSVIDALIAAEPDLIVECAGHEAISHYGAIILAQRIDLCVASLGALADKSLVKTLQQTAESNHVRLIFPSGAIGGLDLLSTLARDGSVQVAYTGTKPPTAWRGSPAETLVDLAGITGRTVFFTGTGREAALAFPKNANVVAALALAGAGFDRMTVSLVADPKATANVHAYDVTSDACTYQIAIENIATPGNAKTSLTTVLSLRSEVLKCADEMRRKQRSLPDKR